MSLKQFFRWVNCGLIFLSTSTLSGALSHTSTIKSHRKRSSEIRPEEEIVIHTVKKINIEGYPHAFNPSLIHTNQGLLLSFRNIPYPTTMPWISEVGLVFLDEKLNPIGKPHILNTRQGLPDSKTPSQSEDVRLFNYKGDIYIIFNDNIDIINPSIKERRDMYVAQLFYSNNKFTMSVPFKFFHEEKYPSVTWQKNWVPFEWKDSLLFSYAILPHEVLCPDLKTGACTPCFQTKANFEWSLGPLRGGTPAINMGDHYLAFFHSQIVMSSSSSNGKKLWHYMMGAYTFSADPPFNILSFSPDPIMHPTFYTYSDYEKRVIFPGGFVCKGSRIFLAYGKDDKEVWIATIDKDSLYQTLVPVTTAP